MDVIKTYEEFAPTQLQLPPYSGGGDNSKEIYFLNTLYDMNQNDIISTAEYIRDKMDDGYYIKVKHLKSKIELINQNEPIKVRGGIKRSTIPLIGQLDNDSILIYIEHDKTILVLSVKDDYQITFVKPTIKVTEVDPYGEEDWEDSIMM